MGASFPWVIRIIRMFEFALIGLGALAIVGLLGLNAPHPPVCLVQVEGRSMNPTLRQGDQVIFARLPWRTGSIVIADVDEDCLVVKRVACARSYQVLLTGDNRRASESYVVPPACVKGVMLCRLPFRSPFGERASATEY